MTRDWNTGHPLPVSIKDHADPLGRLHHMHRADLLESLLNAAPKGLLRLDTRCTSVASHEGSAVLTMSDSSGRSRCGRRPRHSFSRPLITPWNTQPARFTGECAGARSFLSRCFRTIMCARYDGMDRPSRACRHVCAGRRASEWCDLGNGNVGRGIMVIGAQPQELMSSMPAHRDLRTVPTDRALLQVGLFGRTAPVDKGK